jgi:hypothetical protein
VNETAPWQPLDIPRAAQLSDARRQLHHAAQLATAFGISYLEKKSDDSHTNLEWIDSARALASNEGKGARVLVRVHDLTIIIGDASFGLSGRTMNDAGNWIREQLSNLGFDPLRFTLKRHYEIPEHPVGSGSKFDANADDLEQLSRWYSNSATIFESVRASNVNASEVRCWPHHFDLGTLLTFDGGRSVGSGMEPGDTYYDEPYFYVNMYPSPMSATLPPALAGHGRWHTREWIGAVLRASKITPDGEAQESQVRSFLKSAIDLSARLIGAR